MTQEKDTASEAISLKKECCRKLIHTSSVVIPILYYFYDRAPFLSVLVPITVLVVLLDWSRNYISPVRKLVHLVAGSLLRSHEVSGEKRAGLMGASYVLIGASLCIAIFPKAIAIASLAVMSVADTAAALIGKKWGRRPLMGKTVEGFIACALFSLLVLAITGLLLQPDTVFYRAVIPAALAAAAGELFSTRLRVDDNLIIPLACGIVLWIGTGLAAG